jgi:uncharacterized protein (DUF1330 family)
MPANVITYLEVTDRERFDEYRRLARPTFARDGGRPIVVDGDHSASEPVGELEPDPHRRL